MTDLEINIELAKAMGWDKLTFNERIGLTKTGFVILDESRLQCTYAISGCSMVFDYRDPVIFVAICKRWEVSAFFRRNVCYCYPDLKDYHEDSIEKAAALCVIDAVKRGVK